MKVFYSTDLRKFLIERIFTVCPACTSEKQVWFPAAAATAAKGSGQSAHVSVSELSGAVVACAANSWMNTSAAARADYGTAQPLIDVELEVVVVGWLAYAGVWLTICAFGGASVVDLRGVVGSTYESRV